MAEDLNELIQQASRGNRDAYQELIELYSKRIYAMAYQMIGNVEDAQDITQEVFMRLYRDLAKFKPTSRFSTWLYRLTMNLSIDFLRKRKRQQHRALDQVADDTALADPHPLPDADVERRQFKGAIARLTKRLSLQQQSVFILRDLQDFTTNEISQILSCRASTVRVHLAKARMIIREGLEKDYPELCGDIKR